MRTTEPSGRGVEPGDPAPTRSTRSTKTSKAAVAKIVLTGCSTGAALGMVGVMAMAEPPLPELQQSTPPEPAAAAPTTTTAPVTLPPRKVIRYVYRQVIVPDGANAAGAVTQSRTVATSHAAPAARAAATPAPAPVPAPTPKPAAVTTTTTKAS